jgi:dTDP-4-amino-4,6-dideoxygalactose transaminase
MITRARRNWSLKRKGVWILSDWRIPLSDLDFDSEEMGAVQRVILSKWLSMGQEVRAFETEFCAMQRARHALAVANASAGLHLAFLALQLGPGDEIVQPALNFVAAANMTKAVGATPVFADIISLTEPTINPSHVERILTPRTKALVVMHYGGNLCRMAELSELCRNRGLALIEDACHAVGARYRDRDQRPPHGVMAGSIGDISAFSFFANKNLASGEGGMVVTNRDDLAERVQLLRSHGMSSLTWQRHKGHASSYNVVATGYNYRLDELHAAVGRAQLSKLERNNERRRRLLAHYRECLQVLKGWEMPFAASVDASSGHLMVALAPTASIRNQAINALLEARIQSSMHYPCICDLTAFQQQETQGLPNTRQFTERAISLPLFPTMTFDQVQHTVECLRSI